MFHFDGDAMREFSRQQSLQDRGRLHGEVGVTRFGQMTVDRECEGLAVLEGSSLDGDVNHGELKPPSRQNDREWALPIHRRVSGNGPHDEDTELRSAFSAFRVNCLENRP